MAEDARKAWGRYAPRFAAEGRGAEDRDSLRRLVELVAPEPGSWIVDVGAGAGYTGFAFARAGARVVLLDPTHEMLQAAARGWTERDLPGPPRCLEAWAEGLPFGDGAVDAVVAHRAPHQFADRAAFLAEARRVVRPGGVVGLADQSPPDGWEDWHNDLERLRDPTHDRALSPSEWRRLATEAGLTVERTDVVYQPHDVEDWLDRVDAPPDRREGVRRVLRQAHPEAAEAYAIAEQDGRLRMRTPQVVLVALAPRTPPENRPL